LPTAAYLCLVFGAGPDQRPADYHRLACSAPDRRPEHRCGDRCAGRVTAYSPDRCRVRQTANRTTVSAACERAETAKEAATITSATATIGAGTETETNVGPPCTSGTLLHIKLIGTFPRIAISGSPTDDASSEGDNYSASAELITADAESGKACLISVQTGTVAPDPGATLLFTH
jgi:hypothetical protein